MTATQTAGTASLSPPDGGSGSGSLADHIADMERPILAAGQRPGERERITLPSRKLTSNTTPDIAGIRKRVPVLDVARKLGVVVIGQMARCWRPNNHEHGDRTPSVGFDLRRNRVRCFVCDPREYSNIDLVMLVNGGDLHDAVVWLTKNFNVPTVPKGIHLEKPERWQPYYRAGIADADPLAWLVKIGLFATFSPSEKACLAVLLAFADENRECIISYRGLMRYGGVRSFASVSTALQHLQELHILERTGPPPNKALSVVRAVGQYRLTLDHPDLEAFALGIREQALADIEVERLLRGELRRKIRQQATDKIHAPTSEARTREAGAGVLQVHLSSTTEASDEITLQSAKREIEIGYTVQSGGQGGGQEDLEVVWL